MLRHLDREIRSRIPYGFLESHGWAEPVASEIVLDPDLIAIPEYRARDVEMRDGAEVWEVLDDGTQRLFAVLRRGEWIPVG